MYKIFDIQISEIFFMPQNDIASQTILKYLKNIHLTTLWKYLLTLEES